MTVLTFAEESQEERKTETVSLSLPSRKDQSLIKYKFEFCCCENAKRREKMHKIVEMHLFVKRNKLNVF